MGPFITWDFQDEALNKIFWCIDHDEDLVIEKSREMGASWLCLIAMEYRWHFRKWQKFLCISRSEAAVEDDDPDSLFWKLDHIHRYQPEWLKPAGYIRNKLFFGTGQGSTITGQASTGRAGVGGRATAMFIDEFSQIKEDFAVLHRTSDTTGCRIFNGTHLGTETAFYQLTQRVDMKKLVMHWTQHPDKNKGLYKYDGDKNRIVQLSAAHEYPHDYDFVMVEAPAGGPHPGVRSPWYDKECLRKGSPRAVAMDLDIDAGGSVSQFFNALLVRSLTTAHARPPVWEGDIEFDRESGRPIRLVDVVGGPVKLWIQPKSDTELPRSLRGYGAGVDASTGSGATNSVLSIGDAATGHKVLEYATANMTPDKFAPVVTALCWLFKNQMDSPPLLAWEQPGPGQLLGKLVLEMGYPNVYWREANQTLAGGKVSRIPGWHSNTDTKLLLLEEYRSALDQRHFINPSEQALKECLPYRYVAKGVEHPHDERCDDPTGARVNHGDRVIADALAWKMMKQLGAGPAKKSTESSEELATNSLEWRRKWRHNQERDDWT